MPVNQIDAIIDIALPLIAKYEGFHPTPYTDSVGVWTIGYGTTWIAGQPVTRETAPLTESSAQDLLSKDCLTLIHRLRRASPNGTVGPNSEAALLSFAYNLGFGALRGSTLFRRHVAGEKHLAALEFPRWVFAGGRKLRGLVLRREAERQLYLKD
jgi:lysozyme